MTILMDIMRVMIMIHGVGAVVEDVLTMAKLTAAIQGIDSVIWQRKRS